ncbi:glycosyltransferase family 92 protein RCOM_0530710-like [Durio zibethinus]|uniref:Glycosyltransferase family 92 protein n=1 Tax=Durio zibethinus TaxID=66656 RepID=A0A6P5XYU0_DURZI|nr:glycosyltransferase family 92 protein RCOM_0530710-like [Durio zibethinus]
MDSEQRRKRKRIYRPYSRAQFLSVRSLILCLSFLVFLLFLSSDRFPIRTASFHPVLSVPSFSILSKSSLQDSFPGKLRLPLRVEDRVLFPDHLLLLVAGKIDQADKLDCVYYKILDDSGEIVKERKDKDIVHQVVLAIDEYEGFRSIVRCPIPPRNYSAAVALRRRGDGVDYAWSLRSNQTVHSWNRIVYEAAFDGKTAVVFVKGLNLRPHRASDPTRFRCQFGLGNGNKDEGFVLMTEAIAAAQEVVRCSLPSSIRNNPDKAEEIRVTVVHAGESNVEHEPVPSAVRIHNSRSYVNRMNQRRHKENVPMPSVAKLYDSKSYQKRRKGGKYELCACTMLWNQAPALREWIMYHAWLGVERWFVYDNNSDDGIQQVIEELDFQDYNVSRHTWPWIKTQEAGFSHCALRAREECKWVGFFDVDEFYYFPRHHRRGLPGQNLLRSLVANYSSSRTIAEIRTACHSFGPSGLSSPPSQGVTVGYTCRLQSPERHKSIVRPDLLNETLLNVVHHFQLRKGLRYLNVREGSIVINHYKYQVWETFRAKFFRRVATYVVDWQQNQNQGSKDRAPGLGTEAIEPPNWRLQFCEIWDTGLRDFVLTNLADPATGAVPWEKALL